LKKKNVGRKKNDTQRVTEKTSSTGWKWYTKNKHPTCVPQVWYFAKTGGGKENFVKKGREIAK